MNGSNTQNSAQNSAQNSDFQRREQELKAREQELRLKELELEIQRLEDPATPVPAADYSPTRKHVPEPSFMQRLSRKAKLAAQFAAFAALGIGIVAVGHFIVGIAFVLTVGAAAYFFLFSGKFES
jgi:hypothetical protein